MIEINRCDDAQGRVSNDIGGVKPPAQANFQDQQIGRHFAETPKRLSLWSPQTG
jgi:hypothetical protein